MINQNSREVEAETDYSPSEDQIKCPSCPSGWEDLIKFKPPKEIYDQFDEKNSDAPNVVPPPIWYVHEIENAGGTEINLDN